MRTISGPANVARLDGNLMHIACLQNVTNSTVYTECVINITVIHTVCVVVGDKIPEDTARALFRNILKSRDTLSRLHVKLTISACMSD